MPRSAQSTSPGEALLLKNLLFRGGMIRPEARVITRGEQGRHVQTLPRTLERAGMLAHLLASAGIQPGDRVATLMWNTHHHLEAYVSIPCMGAVLHALNLRLSLEDLAWIVEDAGDVVILADSDNAVMANDIAARVECVREVIIADPELDWPDLNSHDSSYDWPDLDETSPMGICHTSGTTGRPRGVVYSHRSTWLHTILISLPDVMGLSWKDRVLNVVPMFHALSWGMPYAACMLGSDQILPGPRPHAEDLLELIDGEGATVAAGVPTVWASVQSAIQKEPDRWQTGSLERILCGGGRAPRELRDWYHASLGVTVHRSWGMTELNPVGTWSLDSDGDDAGVPLPGLQLKIETDDGRPIAPDGETMGRLLACGPTVVSSYLHDSGADSFEDGWLVTGDIATLNDRGSLELREREKDVIKSGGEWISSIDLEMRINAVESVEMSAVVGRAHPHWGERPVAMVVMKSGHECDPVDLQDAMADLLKWQRPDDFIVAEALPMTGTGKVDKRAIRAQLDRDGYVLPDLRDQD
ncbi:MAG: AMP-binding protein [Phycisphaerales bacterium]|nr:AMP-binding protein [Phycisphaerales bacterium]